MRQPTCFGPIVRKLRLKQWLAPWAALAGLAVCPARADAAPPDDAWGLEPLGAVVAPSAVPAPRHKRFAEPGARRLPVSGGKVQLVADGRPRAVIVLPAQPTAVDRWGAEQIRRVVAQISGAQLAIVGDEAVEHDRANGQCRLVASGAATNAVFIGQGRQSGAVIDAGDLPDEGYRIKTTGGSAIFIVGQIVSRRRIPTEGTRFGITSFLEQKLGWRSLWPGPLGEVFPTQRDITIAATDEIDAPALVQRKVRDTGYRVSSRTETGVHRLGFTTDELERRTAAFREWMAFQRLGTSVRVGGGHSFEGWWEKYGAAHPEWFALQPNGSRVQKPPREVLEFASAELAKEVARVRNEELARDPALLAVSISPNDGSAYNSISMSATARKFDSPSGEPTFLHFVIDGKATYKRYVAITDRYVTFFNRVAELVAKEHPDRFVTAYAYSAYRAAPLYTKVHPNVMIGFVGYNYTNDFLLQKDRENWARWANAASHIYFRPNLFHHGVGYPVNYARALARDFRQMYNTGMFAADVSSIMGHWASQGLIYYIVPRLMWNPLADVDGLIREYCRLGFGGAAPKIEEYFAELESLTQAVAARVGRQVEEELRSEERENVQSGDQFLKLAHEVYTPERLRKAGQLLDAAGRLAENSQVKARIEFLRQGLRYAEIQNRVYALRQQKNADAAEMRAVLTNKYEQLRRWFQEDFYAVGVSYLTYDESWMQSKSYGWKFPAALPAK